MAPDRERRDKETRDRVDELAASNEAWRGRVEAKFRRVAWLLTVCAALTALLLPVGYLSLQGQRLRASRSACLLRDESTDGTIRLLLVLDARPEVVETARRELPRTADCERAARESVPGPSLFGGPSVRTPPPPGQPTVP